MFEDVITSYIVKHYKKFDIDLLKYHEKEIILENLNLDRISNVCYYCGEYLHEEIVIDAEIVPSINSWIEQKKDIVDMKEQIKKLQESVNILKLNNNNE